jgi:hypothetical protein
MKRISILAVAGLALLAGTVAAQDTTKTIGGYGVGYGDGGTVTYGFVGVKVTPLFGGQLFTVYQRGEKPGTDVGGHGAAVIYAQAIDAGSKLHLMLNVGALNNIAADADGELVIGITGGFGLAWSATKDMGVHAWLDGWDTGVEPSIMGYGGVHIRDPAKLLAPALKFIGSKIL